ncbi:MAG: AraC family transcriptional regulator ligand-binding domain-containing protein [Pseudomonadota bacterium]
MSLKIFTPETPALPMNYPGFVFRKVLEYGHSADALLAETGLTENHLRDPHFRSGFQPLRRLLLNAIEQTEDPHLGVTLAQKFQPTFIGLPAYAAINAAQFRAGLEVLERFFFLSFPAIELKLIEEVSGPHSGQAAFRIRSKFPFGSIEYFGFSSAIIAIAGLLKEMLRSDQVATRADMTVSRPDGWHEVENKLGFPVHFEAAENQIIFSSTLLGRPLPGSDPFNHARLVELCEQLAAGMTYQQTPVTQVLAVLEGARSPAVSLSFVAAELGYSERGLRRQLNRSGTSYRKLVDQVREKRARDLLAGRAQSIKAIAATLGFESSSNFSRSFKRWTGLTPKAFRERSPSRVGGGRK